VSATVAEADWVMSAGLVAVMVTVCCAVIVAGAVYRPEELIVPTPELIDQFTAVLLALLTLAANCCVCALYSVDVEGVTPIDTGGNNVIVTGRDSLDAPSVDAVIVTVCCVSMLAGAV
jgi:hypothetical protein